MFKPEITYGYGDVCIIDAITSSIESRSKCNTRKDGMLPIFTAPMSSLVSEKNYSLFQDNGIIPMIPRNIDINKRNEFVKQGIWVSYSLSEFRNFISENESVNEGTKICIDLAKGNLDTIFVLAKEAKDKYGDNIILMSGNIANPETYKEYCRAGIDYCRLNIGAGSVCTSSTQTAIHNGVATLINETYKQKAIIDTYIQSGYKTYKCLTKIVADGGIRNYDDVIKALALGADYVMIGGVLASLIESCAETFYYNKFNGVHLREKIFVDVFDKNTLVTEHDGSFLITNYGEDGTEVCQTTVDKLYKRFYGMASKQGQIDLFGEKKRTAEGKEKLIECTTTIKKWSENMSDFIASSMSYCDILDVKDFNPINVETRLLSHREQRAINK